MTVLSKKATNKDESLKMQMMLSLKNHKGDSSSTEKIWKSNGFFGNQRTDSTIIKANFPENTIVYVNNGSISTVKGGQTAICLDYIILAQILPVINFPDNLDNYQYEDNEVLLYVPLYNTQDGLYRGLKKSLTNIVLRGDELETLYSYESDKEKSKSLYSVNKQPLPNIFQTTAFKKHTLYLMDQRNQEFSKMFMFLPLTLDRKEELNQYSNNVNLHPIDVSFDQLRKFKDGNEFDPADLDNISKRNKIKKVFYFFMKGAADISNHNLIRNSNAFISNGGNIHPEFEFSWVNDSYL